MPSAAILTRVETRFGSADGLALGATEASGGSVINGSSVATAALGLGVGAGGSADTGAV